MNEHRGKREVDESISLQKKVCKAPTWKRNLNMSSSSTLFFFFHQAANIILLMVLSLLRRLQRYGSLLWYLVSVGKGTGAGGGGGGGEGGG